MFNDDPIMFCVLQCRGVMMNMTHMRKVTGTQARQLLHNKFVVVLGASGET